MAVTVAKNFGVSFGNYNGAVFTFTGDGSVSSCATGINKNIVLAIPAGASADHVSVELNVTDGSTAEAGTVYWDTVLGSSATAKYLLIW